MWVLGERCAGYSRSVDDASRIGPARRIVGTICDKILLAPPLLISLSWLFLCSSELDDATIFSTSLRVTPLRLGRLTFTFTAGRLDMYIEACAISRLVLLRCFLHLAIYMPLALALRFDYTPFYLLLFMT